MRHVASSARARLTLAMIGVATISVLLVTLLRAVTADWTLDGLKTLVWQDAVAALGAALVGLAAARVVAIAMTRSLDRLTTAAERIEAGDLDTPIELTHCPPELEQLGRTLQRMASALKKQEEVRRETIGDLAHELRTPLAGLRGRVEGTQDGVFTDMPAQLEAMHSDVLRLARLMEDFERLHTAQQPSILMTKDPVDLAVLAHSRGRAFGEFFRANGIDFVLDVEPAVTLGDGERLGQVIDNLLSNALRYTDPGGRVTLRILEGPKESIIEVGDNGIGIAPDDLGRIFDRFWRSDKSRSRATGGSGIGLALVREIVTAHEGHVDVFSLPGRGSRFRVHLPSIVRSAPTVLRIEILKDVSGVAGSVCYAALTRNPGPGDWAEAERALLSGIRDGAGPWIVDVDRVTSLDERGTGMLVAAHALAKARDTRLVVLRSAQDGIGAAIEDAGLAEVLVGKLPEAAKLLGGHDRAPSREPAPQL